MEEGRERAYKEGKGNGSGTGDEGGETEGKKGREMDEEGRKG